MTVFCRVCEAERSGKEHKFREMMFGTRDEFAYFECNECGSIQIKEVPDLTIYYPPDYISFEEERGPHLASKLKYRLAARAVGRYYVNGSRIGRFVLKKKPWLADHFPQSLLDPQIKLDLDMRILDVGCGHGHLLQELSVFGFRDLTGVDAFIPQDILLSGGVRLLKGSLERATGKFDLVMMHHTFEHMEDPRASLEKCLGMLANGGKLLIRIPVVSFAWQEYGRNWVQLDPPRHLILYTERGFRKLAENCGYKIEKVVYDSTGFQFWGSTLYKNDVSLAGKNDEKRVGFENAKASFSRAELDEWERHADKLNAECKGDQACFYLSPR